MSARTYISQLSPVLFWDVDREHMDTEQHSAGLIQCVLEHGTLQDTIRRIASAESGDTPIRRLATAELEQQAWQVPADKLFYRLPLSHLAAISKIDKFKHEYASQMNMYINYYKHEIMTADDNPPIGLLLCRDYSETVVKYATGGLDPNLFVQKYHIKLPSEAELKAFIAKSIRGTE